MIFSRFKIMVSSQLPKSKLKNGQLSVSILKTMPTNTIERNLMKNNIYLILSDGSESLPHTFIFIPIYWQPNVVNLIPLQLIFQNHPANKCHIININFA